MTEGPSNSPNPEIESLKTEIERIRGDVREQTAQINGRIDVMEEKVNSLNRLVFGILIALIVTVLGAVILRVLGFV